MVAIGAVVQSNQGMASSMTNAQTLTCGVHEVVRHDKNGMLKCAPAVKVPDCTERTNLRKRGTGDMFFTYVAKVCLGQRVVGGQSKEVYRESYEDASARARAAYTQSSTARYSSSFCYSSPARGEPIILRGMSLVGGVGQGTYQASKKGSGSPQKAPAACARMGVPRGEIAPCTPFGRCYCAPAFAPKNPAFPGLFHEHS